MKNKNFKAAIIQDSPVFLNLAETITKAKILIREAAAHGANVIAFPESWFPGYPVWIDSAPKAAVWDYPPSKELFSILFDNSMEIPGRSFEELLGIAKETGVCLMLNVHEKRKGTLYNTSIYINGPNGEYKLHRKLVPTYTERLVWGRGDGSTINIIETEYGNLGGLICWEHWMPLARAAMHSLNETLHYACWPWVHELHQNASRNYAFEGQCFVLTCGCTLTKKEILEGYLSVAGGKGPGYELLDSMPFEADELVLKGHSAIIGPDAKYIAEPFENEAGIIYAELDSGKIAETRLFVDSEGHYSRPDVFTLNVDLSEHNNVNFNTRDLD